MHCNGADPSDGECGVEWLQLLRCGAVQCYSAGTAVVYEAAVARLETQRQRAVLV